uniref:Histidinol dehydrogenase putative n=1 Tax=Albugo laibachii Nc14 TaxID=890382 RepID=F0WVD1_9STRA|nr:histidinol dehydrogenase putative [Albugo laibachii Nc14]|eukprot:CCA25370.1 histidinol dehydrogenase putative [Albugo laibachii Nc14]
MNTLMQSFCRGKWRDMVQSRTLSVPIRFGKIAFVDECDVADVIVTLCQQHVVAPWDAKEISVTGPEPITFPQAADILSNKLQQVIRHSYFPIWAMQPALWIRGLRPEEIANEIGMALCAVYTNLRALFSSNPISKRMLRQVEPKKVSGIAGNPVDADALIQARGIVEDVEKNGLSALYAHAIRLGDLNTSDNASPPIILTPKDMENAFEKLSVEEQSLLQRTASRIETFAKLQRNSIHSFEHSIDGGIIAQDIAPMCTAGCYAPGGRYPLPSSVLMTAITARAAGVQTVIVASPRPTLCTLAAAHVAKADSFLIIGGAQAIAAMAYGVGVPACDIIVGPGNKWVTAAKSLVNGKCAIDMLAGPSECLVLADETANAQIIASDLLAQAEHDTVAVPILVSTSQKLIDQVNCALIGQLETLSTRNIANESIRSGFAVKCAEMKSAIAIANELAPEHLEVCTENAMDVAKQMQHYGAMFIGTLAAEVFGDYGAGPNHVLPTGRTAKHTGGLSVHTFLRIRTWMRIDDVSEAQPMIRDAVQLARMEGLEGHARSAEMRLEKSL